MRAVPDGRMKVTLLTVKPANPEAPTAAELNAGQDLTGVTVMEGSWLQGPKGDPGESYGEACVRDIDEYAEGMGLDPWAFTRPPRSEYKTEFSIQREGIYRASDYPRLEHVAVPGPSAILVFDGSKPSLYGHVSIVYRMRYRRTRPLIHNGGRPRR